MNTLESAIYVGRVMHARRSPRPHVFSYRLHMLYLDLDELDALPTGPLFGVEKKRPLSFFARDYGHDPECPLKAQIQALVEKKLGVSVDGPVRMLTQVRSLGYVFNPVTFYYCYGTQGSRDLRAIVAEITNTPWSERHSYVLPADADGARQNFEKTFHISPFFPMDQGYRWSLSAPSKTVTVAMQNHEAGREVFRARLALVRRPMTAENLRRVALMQPLMSWKVHAAIYWQALRLWMKGTPFFVHPNATPATKRLER